MRAKVFELTKQLSKQELDYDAKLASKDCQLHVALQMVEQLQASVRCQTSSPQLRLVDDTQERQLRKRSDESTVCAEDSRLSISSSSSTVIMHTSAVRRSSCSSPIIMHGQTPEIGQYWTESADDGCAAVFGQYVSENVMIV